MEPKQKEILFHTLGLNYNDSLFRNWFATSDNKDIEIISELEKSGMMTMQKELFGEKVFIATAKGIFAAIKLYHKSKPKETRAKKRYKAYLNSESDQNFIDWLRNPYWDDYRNFLIKKR